MAKEITSLSLLAALVLFILSPPSFINFTDDNKNSMSDYWENTELNSQVLVQYINQRNCYSNQKNFFGCLNAVRYVMASVADAGVELTLLSENPDVDYSWKMEPFGANYRKSMQFQSTEKLLAHLKTQQKLKLKKWKHFFDQTSRGDQQISFEKTVLNFVKTHARKSPEQELIASALNGYLSMAQSPHDHLIPLDLVLEESEKSEEEYSGIGVILRPIAGHLIVVRTLEGGSAQKAGLIPGDILSRIQGKSVNTMPMSEANQAISSIQDSQVELEIYRKGQKIKKIIQKEKVQLSNVSSRVLKDKRRSWGMIQVTSFQKSEACADIEREILEFEENEAISGYVLDLRDNPGGLIDQALCTADLFLPPGTKMLEVRPEDRNFPSKKYLTRFGRVTKKPLVILINAGSASSSEIVAGVLRDNHRAVLLGERTFGKGTVLQGMSFQDGHFPNVVHYQTFAKFYFPSGKTNHITGLEPDYKLERRSNNPSEDRSFEMREEDLIFYATNSKAVDKRGQRGQSKLTEPASSCVSKYYRSTSAKAPKTDDLQAVVATNVLDCISSHSGLQSAEKL